MKNILRLLIFVECFSFATISAQNAPVSIAGAVVSLESSAMVPIYAVDFNNINACSLKLSYDSTIATATNVSIGQGLGGMISTNLATPGIIIIGWFTTGGVSLPDSSIIFTIDFSKNSIGSSPVSWIDIGNSCKYSNGDFIILNDSPTSEYYFGGSIVFQSADAPVTTVADFEAFPGSMINIPVTVNGFRMIGSFSLKLQYNPSVMTFGSFINDSEFPGMVLDGSQPGEIYIEGFVPPGDTAKSLEDNSTLFTLNFNYLDGFTELSWVDNGPSCEYGGALPVYPVLNDSPQTSYYINGSVSASYLPAAAGAITGPAVVCAGSAGVGYSVPEIAYASAYYWEVPEEAIITSGQNTNSILLDFDSSVFTGIISVYGSNSYGNGQPAQLEVSSIVQPVAAGLISGPDHVCQGQENVMYSVQPIENATTYNWILPIGCILTNGANTNNITVSFSTSAVDGEISVFGSNMCGAGPASAPLLITVNEIPLILTQPESPPAVYAGSGEAKIFMEATGTDLSFQWQEFNISWTNLNENEMYAGVHTDTLKVMNPTLSMNGFRYRCLVTGTCEPPAITDGNASLTVLMPVWVKENTTKVSLQVYPNPCSTELNLNFFIPGDGELWIRLYDLVDECFLIMNRNSINRGNHSVKLNTTALKPGLYLLELNFNDGKTLMITTRKIVCYH